jgi:hypothetical protein
MTFKDHRVDWLTAGRDDQYSVVGQNTNGVRTGMQWAPERPIHESTGRALVQRRQRPKAFRSAGPHGF